MKIWIQYFVRTTMGIICATFAAIALVTIYEGQYMWAVIYSAVTIVTLGLGIVRARKDRAYDECISDIFHM